MSERMSFADWMAAVDRECYKLCGVSIHDLADMNFGDWHEDGLSPKAAAKRAVRLEKAGEVE